MLTIDKIAKGKVPYTRREDIEYGYPDFWNKANECVPILKDWQEKVLEILPQYKNRLPSCCKELKTNEQKLSLLNYIKLRSVYSMASSLMKTIDLLGHDLSDVTQKKDEEVICKRFQEFQNMYNHIIGFRSEIITDDVAGFFRLYDAIVNKLGYRYDFSVIQIKINHAIWSYRDIIGHIRGNGLQYFELSRDAYECTDDPTMSDIKGFMMRPEDFTKRLY